MESSFVALQKQMLELDELIELHPNNDQLISLKKSTEESFAMLKQQYDALDSAAITKSKFSIGDICMWRHNGEELDVRIMDVAANYTLEVLRPTRCMLKACPHPNCKFGPDRCRFLHQPLQALESELSKLSAQESESSDLHVGDTCEAEYIDDGKGIWYRAMVEELNDTEVLVSFIGYGSSHWLDVSKVFRRVEDDSESDQADTISHPTVDAVRSTPSAVADAKGIGEWQAHTTGVGLSLLMKFGYRLGGGLGRHGQGRVEPVPIVILDEGKGLELASENARTYEGKKVKQVVRLQPPQPKPEVNEVDAFGFINSAINRPKRQSSSGPKLAHLNEEQCRARLLKLSEHVSNSKAKVHKLRSCVQRHERSRDPAMLQRYRTQLKEAEAVLQQAEQQQKAISHTRKKQKDSSMKKFRF